MAPKELCLFLSQAVYTHLESLDFWCFNWYLNRKELLDRTPYHLLHHLLRTLVFPDGWLNQQNQGKTQTTLSVTVIDLDYKA